jgi:hypothetical protein
VLTMILSPVPGLSTVAEYVLVTLPPTATRGASAWTPGPRCPRRGTPYRRGRPGRLLVLDAPSHPYLAYRLGVPLTAAVWREGRLAAARPRVLGG